LSEARRAGEGAHEPAEAQGVPAASGKSGEDRGALGPLAEEVRARLVDYASDVLGAAPEAEIPTPLRRVARFEPRRRARLAGPQIAAQLETDESFRDLVARRVEQAWPGLVRGLREGTVPSAAEPADVAAAAYLVRPDGWSGMVERADAELRRRAQATGQEKAEEAIVELRAKLDRLRSEHRAEVVKLRGELRAARSTIADLRRELHAQRGRAKEAVRQAEEAAAQSDQERSADHDSLATLEKENRRLRARLEAAENRLDTSRRAARQERNVDAAKLRVLIDILLDASHGLRRELALPAGLQRPADLAEEGTGARPVAAALAGLSDDDPGMIDRMLALPGVHLLVDGYNVTQEGYGRLPLADQRHRLLTGLEGLASRTKAEITCVFDGADADPPPATVVAGRVRLRFSEPGETADDVIVRLVRAEPAGRPVAVVSSDGEVAAAVRRAGARSLGSRLLLERLSRM
jgi:predicted RNA-binding protein with PIN domain